MSSCPILLLAASLSAFQIAIKVGNDGNEGTGLVEEMGHRSRFLCHLGLVRSVRRLEWPSATKPGRGSELIYLAFLALSANLLTIALNSRLSV